MKLNKRTLVTNDDHKAIPLFEGRPERDKVIGYEDTLNISILLNTENNFETLLLKL